MGRHGLQEEAKNDGAVAGRGLSEVCYGTKYLYAMKKDPGAAILPVMRTVSFLRQYQGYEWNKAPIGTMLAAPPSSYCLRI
jgi:hypothetical protein